MSEIICKLCKGTRVIVDRNINPKKVDLCPLCKGNGYIDSIDEKTKDCLKDKHILID